jgi:LCP family protein required for cell wall assembly
LLVTENLRRGMRAARTGNRAGARAAFQSVLDLDSTNETALLWLGYLADDPEVSLAHMTKALESHVLSQRAYAALQWAWRRAAAAPVTAVATKNSAAAIPISKGLPAQQPQVAPQPQTGAQGLGMLLLVIATVVGMIGMPLVAEIPAIAAPAPTLTATLQPTAPSTLPTELPAGAILGSPFLPTPSPTPTSPPIASETPNATPFPTLVPSPAPTSQPSPSPTPMPSPTAVPIGLVVPEPFPIPGPAGFVPSTTLPIPTPVQPVPVSSDAINIVVMGSDQREDWSEWHTDVVQVVSVQRNSKTVSVISIPRDLYLYIPSMWMSRINFADFYGEAYEYEGGGPALVRDTLLYNLGIRMDYYARTNFDGLIGIVDTVGGVDIPVHCQLSDHWPYPDENGEYPILTMQPGIRHMDGETALWYARSRLTTSVFSRERRQQQVLQALWHKGRDAGMLTQVPALWKQGQDMVQTDLPLTEMLELAQIALTIDDRNVRFYNIGPGMLTPWTTPYGGAVFLPVWENIQPVIAEAMAPPPEARLVRTYLPIEVWNGTPYEGWGWLAADRLYRAGFPATVTEADRRDYAETQLLIFSERIKGTGADYLQRLFNLADSQVVHQPGGSSGSGMRLILGADYETCP